jgi:RNA polymerase sigma factor (sigma-70 family)
MPSPSLTLLRTQTDDRLVVLARAGHERAFEAIVERYRRPLLRAARRVLPESRAEDALQQALIAAWTALQRGDEVRDLRAWLYRVVHNTSLNALRVNGYDYDELNDTLRIADAEGDELERRAVVRQTLTSLAALPDRQREALLRTAVSGYTQEEVARDLGISDNAMRQLIHRARVTMRAAATALTPLPLVSAIASGSPRGSLVERIAELAAGSAPAGAAAMLAKTGAAVVLVGGALSGPAIVDRVADRAPRDATAAAATVAPASRGGRPAAAAFVADRAVRTILSGPARVERAGLHPPSRRPRRADGRGDSSRRARERADRSGPGSGRDDSSGSGGGGSGSDDSGSSHSGPGGDGSSEHGSGSGSGSDGGGTSGSGSSGSSGGSSDDSGSGSNGSDSGSNGSDSGTNGSDTSGSSGSGSSDGGTGSGSGDSSDGSGSGSSGTVSGGSGSGGDIVVPLPTATPESGSHGSGHGSDDDGS